MRLSPSLTNFSDLTISASVEGDGGSLRDTTRERSRIREESDVKRCDRTAVDGIDMLLVQRMGNDLLSDQQAYRHQSGYELWIKQQAGRCFILFLIRQQAADRGRS
jgi:hypothetical protein